MSEKTPMESRCDYFREFLKDSPYATLIPTRSPMFKCHAGLGRAKSAVAYELPHRYNRETSRYEYAGVRGGEVYKRVGGVWELLYRVEEGTLPEDLPWRKGE
ncbi:hypothetical protein [Streptomyces wuyuanensis]|uniref:hypothetical protein n=1 Tax=Streptomyces wuyuanensis TaxID=1196353 RepID=UPI00343B8B09